MACVDGGCTQARHNPAPPDHCLPSSRAVQGWLKSSFCETPWLPCLGVIHCCQTIDETPRPPAPRCYPLLPDHQRDALASRFGRSSTVARPSARRLGLPPTRVLGAERRASAYLPESLRLRHLQLTACNPRTQTLAGASHLPHSECLRHSPPRARQGASVNARRLKAATCLVRRASSSWRQREKSPAVR